MGEANQNESKSNGCFKCDGTGKYKDNDKYDCFACKGTGKILTLISPEKILHEGKEYSKGDTIPYTCTSGKVKSGTIVSFEPYEDKFRNPSNNNEVLYTKVFIRLKTPTDADEIYPFHKSMELIQTI